MHVTILAIDLAKSWSTFRTDSILKRGSTVVDDVTMYLPLKYFFFN